jgi:tubulin polyglutamylase TTLL5
MEQLDDVISILNARPIPKSSSSDVRGIKAVVSRPPVRVKSVQAPKAKDKKPQMHTERSAESVIPNSSIDDQQLIEAVNAYYHAKDPEEQKDPASVTGEASGAPALWLRDRARFVKREAAPKRVLPEHKFLIFKPFVEPMNQPPATPADRGYYFRLMNSDTRLVKYLLEDNGFIEVPANHPAWSITWFAGHAKASDYQTMNRYQRVNRFPKMHEMTRKDLMYKNIAKMQTLHGARNFDFAPKTFILPQEAGELEQEMSEMEDYWIVKPCASSQGKGIFLVTRFAEIPRKEYVVCKYISNPLLIDGFKFDLRVYVAITSIHPLRIYLYNEGLVRFATQKFSLDKVSRYMHLTNYSLNKNSKNFVENTDARDDARGSKWSVTAWRKLLRDKGIDDEQIWGKIGDIIIKTVLTVEGVVFSHMQMSVPYYNNCFELLGFDILLDDYLNPWLLEVNRSPSLNCDSPLDQKIKGELIADLFTLIGITPLQMRQPGPGRANKGVTYGAYLQGGLMPASTKKKPVSFYSGDMQGSSGISREEKAIIVETAEEYKRKGNFERIFPSDVSINYKSFFEQERPYNSLLWGRMGKIYRKNDSSGEVVMYQRGRKQATQRKPDI